MLTRTDQLKDAINRCEKRLKIAERNLRECNPNNQRARTKLRKKFERAREDLRWMQKRYDEAMGAGSEAFRREA
jgi:hypothetical protein